MQEILGFHPWFGKIPRRREYQSTPVFSRGEFHGLGRLAGYSSLEHTKENAIYSSMNFLQCEHICNQHPQQENKILFEPQKPPCGSCLSLSLPLKKRLTGFLMVLDFVQKEPNDRTSSWLLYL